MLTRKVTELRQHPEQSRIYGDGPDDVLVESIREKGILVPLLVTKDNVIVSGFRRWSAAKDIGLPTVPVIVFQSEDELDIEEALVHSNRQRVKTRRQIACEAAVLVRVEQQRAFRRKQATQLAGREKDGTPRLASVPVTSPGPNEEVGDTRDKVGQALGISGSTVDKAVAVAVAIDQLEEAGETERAEKLKETLDKRGFEPAFREAKGQQKRKPSAPRRPARPKPEPDKDADETLEVAGSGYDPIDKMSPTGYRRPPKKPQDIWAYFKALALSGAKDEFGIAEVTAQITEPDEFYTD